MSDQSITAPEQVPERNLRLLNLADEVNEVIERLQGLYEAITEEAYDGVPLFATDEENQAVIDRAAALNG